MVASTIPQNLRYAHEEAKSTFGYPPEYKGPRPIEEQIRKIAKIFHLNPVQALAHAKNLPSLPEGAEGWFAIPSFDALGKKPFWLFSDELDEYCRATQRLLRKIKKTRPFCNYNSNNIVPKQFRISVRSRWGLACLAREQPGDILIIAAQLGMRHRGRSVRRVREIFEQNEFGLTSLAVGSILLTHPERIARLHELSVDCPGDEFDDFAGDGFTCVPCFYFNGRQIAFHDCHFNRAVACYGSATGFVPPGTDSGS